MKIAKKTMLTLISLVVVFISMCFGVKAEEDFVYGNYKGFEYSGFDNAVGIVYYSGSDSDLIIPSTIDGNIVYLIQHSAFSNCTSLESIIISDNVTYIGNSAFYNCENLSKITLPNNNIQIGIASFYNTAYYNNDENWNDGVLYIGKHLIDAKENISGNYKIREGTLSIAEGAFFECKNMTAVAIPDSVKEINGAVFSQCEKLEKVLIPDSITSIGMQAFYNATNLSDVYYCGTESEWKNITIYVDNDCLTNANIHFDHNHTDLEKDGVCDECLANVEIKHTHSYISKITKKVTCTSTGIKTFTCSCGDKYTEVIAKKSHTYTTSATQATLTKDGKQVTKCSCGAVKSSTTIYHPKTIKLSATAFTYNGKNQMPSVTVKDRKGKKLKNGTDYTVVYPKKRKSIGKHTVTVTFKGKYSGTKKLTFEIVPAKVTLSKLTAGKKQLAATWKTISGATGYEVVYSTSKKFTKKTTKTVTIKKVKTKKTTIKKLKKGKKYYVKVRAYKTVSGKKIYGAYSAVKSVKVK